MGARVVVRVRHGAGHETLDGDYLIAADGSRSDVRAALGIDFEGEDYPDKILRVMTTDDLDALLPGIAPVTYLWNGMKSVSFLRMPDCWRIILRVPKEVDDAQALDPDWILARLREVMPHIDRLPNVLMKDVYGVSKRVATRYREGRIFLAGDSAHVTNTRGGMNMNCGMHDAYALTHAIIEANGGDARPVEDASDERRRVATQMLIPRTDRNVAGGDAWLDARARDGERPRQDRRRTSARRRCSTWPLSSEREKTFARPRGPACWCRRPIRSSSPSSRAASTAASRSTRRASPSCPTRRSSSATVDISTSTATRVRALASSRCAASPSASPGPSYRLLPERRPRARRASSPRMRGVPVITAQRRHRRRADGAARARASASCRRTRSG